MAKEQKRKLSGRRPLSNEFEVAVKIYAITQEGKMATPEAIHSRLPLLKKEEVLNGLKDLRYCGIAYPEAHQEGKKTIWYFNLDSTVRENIRDLYLSLDANTAAEALNLTAETYPGSILDSLLSCIWMKLNDEEQTPHEKHEAIKREVDRYTLAILRKDTKRIK